MWTPSREHTQSPHLPTMLRDESQLQLLLAIPTPTQSTSETTVASLVVTRAQTRAAMPPEPDPLPDPSPVPPEDPSPACTDDQPSACADDQSPARADDQPAELNTTAEVTIAEIPGTTTAQLHVSTDFTHEIVEALTTDRTFKQIYKRLFQQMEDTRNSPDGQILTLHLFRIDPSSELLYLMDSRGDRVAVPASLRTRFVRSAHDARAHVGVNRTYAYLRSIAFFPRMKEFVTEYIKACLSCRLGQPRRSKPYGDLSPLPCPDQPLSVLSLDFVVGLPMSPEGNDCALLVTCLLAKFVKTLIGKTTDTAEQWASRYMERVYTDWGLPDAFVSDMDSKFVGAVWTSLCHAAQVDVRLTAAHHSAANGQSERMIQTFELGLIVLMGARFDTGDWESLAAHVTHCMNTSVSATTKQVPFEVLYGRRAKTFLPVEHQLGESFGEEQQALRQEARDAVALAQTKMKIYYDDKHESPPVMAPNSYVYVKLAKPGHRGYHLHHQTKLTFLKVGPYRIKERLSRLKYKIELPSWLKWNPDTSIEHLEPAFPDPFHRPQPDPGPITQDGVQKWIIDDILAHSTEKRPGDDRPKRYYNARWMGYDGDTWEPEVSLMQDVPRLLKAYKRRHGLRD